MSDPYRESSVSVACPRCGRTMPSGELAACAADCGMWLAASAASRALAADELAPSRLTSWARERVACPICGTQMTLRGHDMTLFQGCDGHGFWLDRETVMQTGLAHPRHAPWLADARARAKALAAELRRAEEETRERAAKLEREESEAAARAWQEKIEREKAERREQAARAALREPYASALREMMRSGFPDAIADLLAGQERTITKLAERVNELERQLGDLRAARS